MDKFVITIQLPDGKNYFCRFLRKDGINFNEWDTDINYAMKFNSRYAAKTTMKQIGVEAGEMKIEPYNPVEAKA